MTFLWPRLRRLFSPSDQHRPGRRCQRLVLERLEERTVPQACPAADPFLFTPVVDPQHSVPLALHIHARLTILINGRRRVIPATVGHVPGGLLPLHTHDTSGVIHIESPVVRTFRLKDFFCTWGQTFNRQQILNRRVNKNTQITMFVNGHPHRAFGNLILRDGQDIVISFARKNAPPPVFPR